MSKEVKKMVGKGNTLNRKIRNKGISLEIL